MPPDPSFNRRPITAVGIVVMSMAVDMLNRRMSIGVGVEAARQQRGCGRRT